LRHFVNGQALLLQSTDTLALAGTRVTTSSVITAALTATAFPLFAPELALELFGGGGGPVGGGPALSDDFPRG
jgi:hypothetical protein